MTTTMPAKTVVRVVEVKNRQVRSSMALLLENRIPFFFFFFKSFEKSFSVFLLQFFSEGLMGRKVPTKGKDAH